MKKANPKLTTALILLLSVACAPVFGADGLVLHLSFDQGTINNGVATDLSGQGNDGLVTGDPQHAEGVLGDALVFDGIDDVIEVPLQPSLSFEQGDSFSVMAWVKTSIQPSLNDGIVGNYRTSTAEFWALLANDTAGGMTLYLRDVGRAHTSRLDSPDPINTDTWIHVAGVRDQQTKEAYLYIDGEVVASMPDETENINSGQSIWIGDHLNRFYDGLMDDVRIYNTALDQAAIQQAMKGTTELASAPNPENDAADVLRDVTLTWEPGEFAAKHTVYLGADFDNVNTASMDVLVSDGQDASAYDAGALAFGQTYYWRVDEVNGAPDRTVFVGDVWRFTVEPLANPIENVTATASGASPNMEPEKTIDDSGLNAMDEHSTAPADMWLTATADSWIQYEFDKAYKLHEMMIWNSNQVIEAFIGFGVKEAIIETALDGENWMAVNGVGELAKATGAATYVANNAIAMGDVMAKYVKLSVISSHGGNGQSGLSEVRFLAIPVTPREPQPADGATTADPTVELSWRSGREAASHQVYLGTDAANLTLIDTTSEAATVTNTLDYDMTYTWSVTEVNEAADPTSHIGGIWRFSTPEYAVVDDFESYSGDEDQEVFMTWWDGFGGDASLGGSTTGHIDGPFVETSNVNPGTGGSQSLPLYIDNDGGFFDIDGKSSSPTFSEVLRELTPAQDWTASGIKTLSIMFAGSAGLTGQLYCKIGNTKLLYDGATENLGTGAWQAWNIDLSTVGGNLTGVKELAIGVEGGTSGILYLDDIRLYPKPGELVVPTEPSAQGLVAHLSFDESSGTSAADSSGNNNHGNVMGDAQWVAGKVGGALAFDGVDDMVVVNQNSGLPIYNNGTDNAYSIAMWVKGGPQNDMRVFSESSSTSGNPLVNMGTHNAASPTGQYAAYIRPDDGTTLNHPLSQADPFDDTWHHIAWVDDNGTATLYVDGQLDGGDFNYTRGTMALDTTTIGGILRAAPSHFFTGQIDEVRIYNRLLSAGEILGLAGKTLPIHKPF
jgi:hypothetical protein